MINKLIEEMITIEKTKKHNDKFRELTILANHKRNCISMKNGGIV